VISVVIPCYNAGKYLAECLESVFSQSLPVGEVIVVDDCSTDDSVEVASRYPVRLLNTPLNGGPAVARNLGISAVKGDLIAWIDADDFWEPNHCEVNVRLLDKYPEADVAFSGLRYYGRPGQEPAEFFEYCSQGPRNVFWACFRYSILSNSTAVIHTEAVRAVGGYDEQMRAAVDFDLWLRLSRRFLFVCTPEITANYRHHAGQISSFPAKQIKAGYVSRLKMLRSVRDEGDYLLSRQIAKRILEIWVEDLHWLCHMRDADQFRFQVSLAGLLPRIEEAGAWNLLKAHAAAFIYTQRSRLQQVIDKKSGRRD
jgi:glycosyltransferase involved in cell wall biosynthesis